jgi:hypothetical protein
MLQVCGSSSWIIPAGLSLPYIWRLCQCIRTWKDTGNTGQAFNALKYSTAFPVIILSAVNFQVSDEDWNKFWKPLWLIAAFLNSAYSYYWDIERDWDIAFFTSPSGNRYQPCICSVALSCDLYLPMFKHMMCCRSEVDGPQETRTQRQTAILPCILCISDVVQSCSEISMGVQSFSPLETKSADSAHFHLVGSISKVSMDFR